MSVPIKGLINGIMMAVVLWASIFGLIVLLG
jgi:hypothetical protein